MKKLLTLLLCVVMLAGCTSSGVSQEEYDEVVAERDRLQEQLNAILGNTQEVVPTEIQNETTQVEDEVFPEDIEIIAEYTLSDGIGWYTRHFLIIKNNSGKTVDVSTSSLAYSADGTMISAADASFDALGAGCTSIMYEAFETEAEIDHYETSMDVSESGYYESVIQDLSYVQNDIDGGSIFQVTNNGAEAAEFVEGYALFFLGEELVGYNSAYFTDDDFELKPGATISKQIDCYDDFDRIEFYLTGRRSEW